MRRWTVLLVVALLAVTALIPVTRTLAQPAPFRIGALYPLSGNQGEEGNKELSGVRLAAELVNHDGGIRGRMIELQVEDAPNADATPAAVRRVMANGVKLVVGTYGSTIALPATERISAAGGIILETGAVADMVTGRGLPGILRTVATGSTLGRHAAQFASDFIMPGLGLDPHTARTVVLYEDDPYGSSVGEGARRQALDLGFNVVDTVTYNIASADYDQIAARVDADSPDIILTASYLEDALSFRRAAVSRHLHVKAIVGTSSAYCLQDFGDELKQDAVGLYASDKPNQDINPNGLRPEGRALLQRARDAYLAANGRPMDAPAVAGFVGGWVLFHEILPRAGSTDRAAIMRAAMSLDIPSGSEINGAGISFSPPGSPDAGQNRRAVSVIWEWISPGHRAVVYPPAYATAAPRILAIVN